MAVVPECAPARESIGALLLGVLPEAEAGAVRAHLADCPDCQREYDELAHLPGLLALAAEPTTPPRAAPESPAVLEGLLNQVRAERAAKRRERSRHPLMAALAAAAAVVLIAVVGGVASGWLTGGESPLASVPVRTLTGYDSETHVAGSVTVIPVGDRSRLRLQLRRVPEYTKCVVEVVGPEGQRHSVWKWKTGHQRRVRWSDVVNIPAARIVTVEVKTADGDRMVDLPG